MSSDGDIPLVICMTVALMPEASVPARPAFCNDCGEPVWVANSTPPAIPVCVWCGEKYMGPDSEMIFTEEQRADLNEHGVTDEEIEQIKSRAKRMFGKRV